MTGQEDPISRLPPAREASLLRYVTWNELNPGSGYGAIPTNQRCHLKHLAHQSGLDWDPDAVRVDCMTWFGASPPLVGDSDTTLSSLSAIHP